MFKIGCKIIFNRQREQKKFTGLKPKLNSQSIPRSPKTKYLSTTLYQSLIFEDNVNNITVKRSSTNRGILYLVFNRHCPIPTATKIIICLQLYTLAQSLIIIPDTPRNPVACKLEKIKNFQKLLYVFINVIL
jgi:hypothetical protein